MPRNRTKSTKRELAPNQLQGVAFLREMLEGEAVLDKVVPLLNEVRTILMNGGHESLVPILLPLADDPRLQALVQNVLLVHWIDHHGWDDEIVVRAAIEAGMFDVRKGDKIERPGSVSEARKRFVERMRATRKKLRALEHGRGVTISELVRGTYERAYRREWLSKLMSEWDAAQAADPSLTFDAFMDSRDAQRVRLN